MDKITFYVQKNGAKKYNNYPVGKIKCIFDGKSMELYLCNFINENGEKIFNKDNNFIGYLGVKIFDSICNNSGYLKIIINDFYINRKEDWGFGFGTLLWKVLLDDCLSWYCSNYMNGIKLNILIYGWLSLADYSEGNWNFSLPFYIGIAQKLISQIPDYTYSRTIIGYNSNLISNSIHLIPCFDSENPYNINKLKKIGKESYCKKLISILSSIKNKSYVVFIFSNERIHPQLFLE